VRQNFVVHALHRSTAGIRETIEQLCSMFVSFEIKGSCLLALYSANHGKNAVNRASERGMMMRADAQRKMYVFAASKSGLIAWSH
jgi:hypothetical protein